MYFLSAVLSDASRSLSGGGRGGQASAPGSCSVPSPSPARAPAPASCPALLCGRLPEIQSALVLNMSLPKGASSKLRIFG